MSLRGTLWIILPYALVLAARQTYRRRREVQRFGSKIYQLHHSFKDLFDPKSDPQDVVIDFYYTRVYDQSGLEAINPLAEKYEQQGKRLHLTHLSRNAAYCSIARATWWK